MGRIADYDRRLRCRTRSARINHRAHSETCAKCFPEDAPPPAPKPVPDPLVVAIRDHQATVTPIRTGLAVSMGRHPAGKVVRR